MVRCGHKVKLAFKRYIGKIQMTVARLKCAFETGMKKLRSRLAVDLNGSLE
jgi:hypothetical protein